MRFMKQILLSCAAELPIEFAEFGRRIRKSDVEFFSEQYREYATPTVCIIPTALIKTKCGKVCGRQIIAFWLGRRTVGLLP